MKTPQEHRQAVVEITPDLYAAVAEENGGRNMAGSNQCHVLSLGLYHALTSRGFDVRREFHLDDETGDWHYLIAHAPADSEPSDTDIITDLNPWQYLRTTQLPPSYRELHGTRKEVMEILQSKEGVPEHFVALRGLATVKRAHTLTSNDHVHF